MSEQTVPAIPEREHISPAEAVAAALAIRACSEYLRRYDPSYDVSMPLRPIPGTLPDMSLLPHAPTEDKQTLVHYAETADTFFYQQSREHQDMIDSRATPRSERGALLPQTPDTMRLHRRAYLTGEKLRLIARELARRPVDEAFE